MAVTSADVQAILDTDLDAYDIQVFLATASLLVSEELSSAGFSSARTDQITKYLAAHLCTFKSPQGRLTSLTSSGIRQEFSGAFGEGLRSSTYGQMVLALETTGVLAKLGDTSRPTCSIELLYDDYDSGEIEGFPT